jgi:hypothetical protein
MRGQPAWTCCSSRGDLASSASHCPYVMIRECEQRRLRQPHDKIRLPQWKGILKVAGLEMTGMQREHDK